MIVNILKRGVSSIVLITCTICFANGQNVPVKSKPHTLKSTTKKPLPINIKKDTTHIRKGIITIEQDSGIDYIMNNFPMPVESKRTVSGYRIQILATTSRQLANDTKAKVMDKYPELRASILFQQPYFKLRIGDFEDYIAAQVEFNKVHKQFPTSFIVPDIVTMYR